MGLVLFPMRGIAPMILNLLFVLGQLLLHFSDHRVHGSGQIFVVRMSDHVVLMFGVDDDFDPFFFGVRILLKIDRDFDHFDAIVIVEQLFHLFLDVCLFGIRNMSMSGRDFNLHPGASNQFKG